MYNEIELKNGEETQVVKFRLTSANAIMLEEKSKKSIIEFMKDESITMVVTMLRYMRMWEQPQFSKEDAQKLYDLLIDNGWSFRLILQDILYETLVCSGFLEKADWEEMKKQIEEATTIMRKKQMEALKSL